MPNDKPTLGEHLRRRRKSLGLNQQDVADRLGLNQSTIAKWENGILLPHRNHFSPLAEFLEKNPSDVLDMCTSSAQPKGGLSESREEFEAERPVSLSHEHYYALQALAGARGTTIDTQIERAITVFLRGLK